MEVSRREFSDVSRIRILQARVALHDIQNKIKCLWQQPGSCRNLEITMIDGSEADEPLSATIDNLKQLQPGN